MVLILSVIKKEIKSGEELLITALKDGDQDAFRQIIEAYQESIIRVCRGFVGNHEDAEDVAQDVFIQLYKSASRLRGEAKLSTWLYRVAVNKSLNHLRSFKARRGSAHVEIAHGTQTSSDNYSDDSITASDHRKALQQAINMLPRNQKTAFILQKYEELSYEEISMVMEMSLSSVQSLIFRAKQNLQDKLKEYFEKNLR